MLEKFYERNLEKILVQKASILQYELLLSPYPESEAAGPTYVVVSQFEF